MTASRGDSADHAQRLACYRLGYERERAAKERAEQEHEAAQLRWDALLDEREQQIAALTKERDEVRRKRDQYVGEVEIEADLARERAERLRTALRSWGASVGGLCAVWKGTEDGGFLGGGTEWHDSVLGRAKKADCPMCAALADQPAPAPHRPLTYLACPYSHADRAVRLARFEAANHAAGVLMAAGHKVFSPISHTHPIAEAHALPLGWDFWEAFDRAYLAHSARVVVLRVPGWDASKGVAAEIAIAGEMGIPVEYVDPAPAKEGA